MGLLSICERLLPSQCLSPPSSVRSGAAAVCGFGFYTPSAAPAKAAIKNPVQHAGSLNCCLAFRIFSLLLCSLTACLWNFLAAFSFSSRCLMRSEMRSASWFINQVANFRKRSLVPLVGKGGIMIVEPFGSPRETRDATKLGMEPQ